MQKNTKTTTTDLEQASARSLLQYRVLFRVLVLFHHLTVAVVLLNIDLSQTKIPELITVKTYSLRYMTAWNFTMQIVYFVLALLCDFLEWMRWNNGTVARKLTGVKDFYFSSLIFPNGLYVTCVFWTIYAVDREHIFPKVLDLVISTWINHSIHTVITAVVLLDLVLQPGKRPLNDSKNKITLYFVCILYQIVLHCTYLEAGCWLYPLYNHFTVPQRLMFIFMVLIIGGISYELQWSLARSIRKFRSMKAQ